MATLDLIEGVLLRRYKRFLADCRLPEDGDVVAHCPNSGSMKTLLDGEPRAWLRHVPDPRRKLKWTLILLEVADGGVALVDTGLPNSIVADGIVAGVVPRLGEVKHLRREVRIGEGTRLDIVIGDQPDPDEETGDLFVEVKNVTMQSASCHGRSDFPDSVTERGRKHLNVLAELSRRGKRAVLFLLLGRTDCQRVGFACDIDPAYCQALKEAVQSGVEIISHRVQVSDGHITLGDEVPVDLP